MPRKYSDKYIEKQIAKIDEMFDRNQTVVDCPDCLTTINDNVFIGQRERNKIKAFLKQVRELAYIQGFWMGWTLRNGLKSQ